MRRDGEYIGGGNTNLPEAGAVAQTVRCQGSQTPCRPGQAPTRGPPPALQPAEQAITCSSEREIIQSSKVACRRRYKHQPTARHGRGTHLAHDDTGHIGAVARPQARRRGVEVRVADQDGLPAAVQQLAGNQVLHVDGQLLAQQLKSDHTSKEGSRASAHRAECAAATTGAQESAIVRVSPPART